MRNAKPKNTVFELGNSRYQIDAFLFTATPGQGKDFSLPCNVRSEFIVPNTGDGAFFGQEKAEAFIPLVDHAIQFEQQCAIVGG
ncbi:MAG: hypothetical protein EBT66_07410 [Bacteroidetes bacterium]|nr:hypothetical protein [Bacteroidota bacterium]